MATLALSIVGSLVGGATIGGPISGGISIGSIIGSAVGAMAGSYIDNTVLFPPKGPKKPAKLDDLPVQTASEGSPINRVLGPEVRIAGTIIWMSELRSKAIRQKTGGKGGKKKSTVGWNYFVDIAVGVCAGEISGIKKIWADSKLVYVDQDPLSETAITLAVTAQTLHYYDNFDGDYLAPAVRRVTMYIESPNGGPDLSQFRSGRVVVSSGWANGDNNSGAPGFKCLESGDVLGGGGETYVVLLNDNAVTEAAGASITLSQVAEKFDASLFDDITIYIGDETQVADDLIEADKGVGEVSGFRGLAYVVFENVSLADAGNRPYNFNFLVEEAEARTVKDAASIILEESRLDSSDYDTNALSALDLTGQITPGPEAPARRLEPLMVAYDLIMQNIDGVLTFTERHNAVAVAIAEDDLAAHEEGGDAPRPLTITDPDDASLPSEIDISFSEPNLNYLRGSQRERKLAGTTPQDNVLQITMPLTLGASEARTIAKRVLWAAWLNRQRVSLQLPPSYIGILENDRLTVTYNPTITVLVQRVEHGHNHVIMIEGVIEDSNVLDQDATADDPDIFAAEIYVPPALLPTLIDIAPLREEDIEDAGFYFGAVTEERRVSFPGGAMYHKKYSGGDYNTLEALKIDLVMGMTTAPLGDAITGIWDTKSALRIRMWEGAPETADEEDVLDGANIAVVGNEIIAFKTVTQLDAENYELTDLLRGLRNTEAEAAVHEGRERFVLLNETGLQFAAHPVAMVGKKRKYKAVPLGSEPSEQESLDVQLGGYTLRCFAPCHVKAKWIVGEDDDLLIYWIRRTRAFVRHFGQPPANTPSLEPSEHFRVQILDAPGGNVVRTLKTTGQGDTPPDVHYFMAAQNDIDLGANAYEVTYTEAQQVADFGSVQAAYDVVVQQFSFRIGWGKPVEESVP